ncbi:MAG: hydantoinase B/oxoprolinase family protein [Gammaproteobacteria bacterium]
MDAIELSLFTSRIRAICDEMGAVLQKTAFSPNIKDRQDFSCAVFDSDGNLCAQAAHIPVHLGSMAFAMTGIVDRYDWQPGDIMILNDPYLGGTHLPDVTLIAPVYNQDRRCGFVANRAHYADIGSPTPGSMPLATRLEDEGLIIPPSFLVKNGHEKTATLNSILDGLHNPEMGLADLSAQISANRCGKQRLEELIWSMDIGCFETALQELDTYANKLARSGLDNIPDGEYSFEDRMDDDGKGNIDIPIRVCLRIDSGMIEADFTGTAGQVKGNINCPLSVAAAAVYYCFHCLMPAQTPACAGSFRSISLIAPEGCLVNAQFPAAVAAGNVETSTRLVDVVLGALAKAVPGKIPAASHGSMNNIAMGSSNWDYYETLGGGMGAGPAGGGLTAVQTHMTNTLNTPVEVLEKYYPLRINRYEIRRDSGGQGRYAGGNGLIREYEFLDTTSVTLLTERRRYRPWGLQGGHDGKCGINLLNGKPLPAKTTLHVKAGDRLTIETSGGGAWGAASNGSDN